MRIGIIGGGRVGQALKTALGGSHEIRIGSRSPTGDEMSHPATADWAEIVVIATPWAAEEEIAGAIAPHVAGKPVVDATNPVGMTDRGLGLMTKGVSAAETLQARLPQAHVVKAFNQLGAEFIAAADRLDARPVMFAAGNDDTARASTLRLISDAGFQAVDAGPLVNACHLEALAMLWIWQAAKGPLGRGFGFAVTYRTDRGPDAP